VVVSVVKEMRAVAKDYVEAIKQVPRWPDTVLLSLPMPLAFVNASVGTLARIYACILTRCERQARLAHDEARYIYEAFSVFDVHFFR